jgi:hypothetical protein
MTKIKLTLENLRVESFTTCAAEGGLGTVFGTVFGNAKTVDTRGGTTGCGPECETYYGNGACSANDGCASSPHAYTPCAGCVETDPAFCVIEVGELG